ncbi:pyrroloquinoline-quinone synthase PqqC [Rickettsiella grylli]|uniref:Pyrroloquinoline-quinone synthase n=1 Tax=Rickettsiella grylli TaxID=59196 RepID=A8PLU4_9COXI|nr:pyrroloquinoline-quinone synthase PqqC [Rickettsiella grylli]EDP46892.1 coenzyme PQQ biosynthesis protein C [Rickettsiella grylli]
MPTKRCEVSLSQSVFEKKILNLEKYYHIHHPFNQLMNDGQLTRQQIQQWVINRFYYQVNIPVKDAAILSNCPLREIRREWVKRIIEHDGDVINPGGIEAWLTLGEACGLTRNLLWSMKYVLPGVRFAVDAYIQFTRTHPWQAAVCSSLTELFAPEIHRQRLTNWPIHYPWMDLNALAYFRCRLNQINHHVKKGLQWTLENFQTHEQQTQALAILKFKLEILWSISDSLYLAYVLGHPPITFSKDDT